ncbi:MAG: hypothetical protein HY298_16585 [Verrucomicrobia bacterium]|nr:hypothetical protein [Verrucomicrobiota bacterium]
MKAKTAQLIGQTKTPWRKTPARQQLWQLVLACLIAGNLSAATLTLVNENFDSYSGAATSLNDTTVAIPNTDYIRVEDGLAQGDSPGGLGYNGVQLINWDYAPGSAPNCMLLRPNTAFRHNLDPRGGAYYTWDFWMLSFKSGTADRGFRISLLQEGADQNAHDFLIFRSGQGTTATVTGTDGVDIIQAFNGFSAASGTVGPNSWVTISNTAAGTPAFVTNNVWTHYKIEADAVARTFKYYVNDMVTPVSVGNSLSRPQNLSVCGIRFANEGNSADDGYTLIDNVKLTVDGEFIDLASGSFTEGFEGYTASNSGNTNSADNNPGGAWVTAEVDGVENNHFFAPTKVQVVNSTVTAPHSGSKCLMVSQGQTAGTTISWGQATNEDVKITWWAKVPAADATPGVFSLYLRVSVYAWEADYSSASDTILFGYGHRGNAPEGSATSIMTFSRWFNEWFNNGSWGDTLRPFTPDTWEEYQLTTDVRHNSYTLIKNPSSTPVVVVKDGQYISSWGNNKKFHTVAFSTSNNSVPGANPPAYVDDITIEPYTNTQTPEPRPYTILGTGPAARFTNYTVLTVPGKTVGGVAVDPRDTNTILFTIDEERIGEIRKATKVASGNWVIDPTPVVSGLYNPNGLTVETNGTIWFVMDGVKGGQASGLRRLKAPWNLNTVEEVITDFGFAPTNRSDQPCDLVFYVTNGVTKLAVLDRGVDLNNNPNAIWVVDPATTTLNQYNYDTALVAPDTSVFGAGAGGNANGIALLRATGELVTIWEGDGATDNGVIVAFDTTTGAARNIFLAGSGVTWGAGIDVDPTTGRIWVSDRKRTTFPLSEFAVPQIVSFDPTSGAFIQELSFTNSNATADRPDRNVNFKDPGMRFSQDGKFLVVSDQGLFSGGGRLLVFHSEPFVIAPITITSTVRTGSSVALTWTSGGAVNYVVQRSTDVVGPYTTISPTLATTQYTDTSSPAGQAFYRVQAFQQN